jgi:lipopolysaccharide transport system permease protein
LNQSTPKVSGLITQFREVYQYREAVRNLVRRDLKVRYSSSVLGIVWSLFSPLLMTLVYYVVFTYLVPSGIKKFPVFILTGLLPWTFFTSSVIGATTIISGNGNLINRVYFPREVLPVANLLANAVNFLIALILLFVFIAIFHIRLGLSLVWLPVIILIQFALSLGFGLFLSAVNVFLRDTQQIVDVSLLAWFFLTPIIYSIDIIQNSTLKTLVQVLNPMAGLVVAYRHVLYSGDMPQLPLLGVTAVEAVVILLFGALVFKRLSPTFAEEV